jgi:Kef-type K+ transport system membrane component KefB
MKNAARTLWGLCLFLVCIPPLHAAENAAPAAGGDAHGLQPLVLLGIAVMLLVAKLGGELFERINQPAVLGELIGGIVIGNLVLLGFSAAEPLKTNQVIAAIAEVGVIILLFEVGLQSDLKEMMAVGWSSLLVAVLGVIAPFLLGWGVSAYFIPDESQLVHIFIGATLCATSVGITARVFKDLGKLASRPARIILGAAVIDDVLGLIILAVVAGAIQATAVGGALSAMAVVSISYPMLFPLPSSAREQATISAMAASPE